MFATAAHVMTQYAANAGVLTLEIISFSSSSGPESLHQEEFSLNALESKLLEVKQLDQLGVFSSSASQDQRPHYFLHIAADIKYKTASDTKIDGVSCPAETTGCKTQIGYRCKSDGSFHAPNSGQWSVVRLLYFSQALVQRIAISAAWGIAELLTSGNASLEGTATKHCLSGNSLVHQVAVPNRAFLKGSLQCAHPKVIDDLAPLPLTSEAVVFFTEFKDAHVWPTPNITATDFRHVSPHMIQFIVSSCHVAPYVAIESALSGRFSKNNFLLTPWQPRSIAFLSQHPLLSTKSLARSLTFLSLVDTAMQL